MDPQKILDFWFEEIDPSLWFTKDEQFDAHIRKRFTETYHYVVEGHSIEWRKTAKGRLAEIIVLDQFSRNMFRDDKRAFAMDDLALHLAKEAVRNGDDRKLNATQKAFLYMPFMHSEAKEAHEEALHLFSQPGLEYNLKFERAHKAIIDRFGRYPHRNKILNRTSSAEEIEFLKQPGSSF
ncbi:DUF924 family protein [Bdellovibrio reynosensis]|uniref:DUF924 domain-containing protein n=1 Tax=Bdellovibrio reynosensis TaxID=2835041 RepID=A0ABY4CAY6_9BACT|nr:DUF924 family protein [Bdellovibrio reynosensis]UOF00673.1 DUF924 domain-containing protein [Bdellovibrio reynosensis]